MAVMRRRRQDEPLFEQRGDLAHRSRQLALDRPGPAGRWRGMVRLVEDEQRGRPEWRKQFTQAANIGLVGEK